MIDAVNVDEDSDSRSDVTLRLNMHVERHFDVGDGDEGLDFAIAISFTVFFQFDVGSAELDGAVELLEGRHSVGCLPERLSVSVAAGINMQADTLADAKLVQAAATAAAVLAVVDKERPNGHPEGASKVDVYVAGCMLV